MWPFFFCGKDQKTTQEFLMAQARRGAVHKASLKAESVCGLSGFLWPPNCLAHTMHPTDT